MLTHLSIRDLAVVGRLSLELDGGLTVLTGETGAGKSILVDALSLALGARAQSDMVRSGAVRAEVTALFDISNCAAARACLTALELDDNDELHLRRTVSADGRSRAYVNGRPVPATTVREIGSHLVDIHGQHEHQSLLQKPQQRALVDQLAGLDDQTSVVADACATWQQLEREREALARGHVDHGARQQLLHYQCEELREFAPQTDEYEALLREHKQLTSFEDVRGSCFAASALLEDGDAGSADELVRKARQIIESVDDPACSQIIEMLETAAIHIHEAAAALVNLAETRTADPERLTQVEQRLTLYQDIARKHQTQPGTLAALWDQLEQDLAEAESETERAATITAEQQTALARYVQVGLKLSKARRAAAGKLGEAITVSMRALGMSGGTCKIDVQTADADTPDFRPYAHGLDTVELLVNANPASPPQPLARAASGGELSRISLAIQVQLARGTGIPSLVFDEVDVGVGGRVAEIVGRMLRDVAGNRQVLCITHLPQVASQGHHHLQVHKRTDNAGAESTLSRLSAEGRVEEIARMLGGEQITARTRAHAREMLDFVEP